MRREELYLRDICEASDSIARFILGLTPAEFRESDLVGSAVVQKLAVIGEAAARVSADLRLRHPENPLAGNHRVPQYSGARVLRHRLGRGMAGSRQTGSRAALPGRRRSRCRVRFSARLTNRCGPCAAPRLTAPGPADVNVPSSQLSRRAFPTWRTHSCVQRRDSSRRVFASAAPSVGTSARATSADVICHGCFLTRTNGSVPARAGPS